MSKKFDEYLKQGNFNQQEKDSMAEMGRTAESLQESPSVSTPVVDQSKTPDKAQPELNERLKPDGDIKDWNKGNEPLKPEPKDSLAKYPEKAQGAEQEGKSQSLERDNGMER